MTSDLGPTGAKFDLDKRCEHSHLVVGKDWTSRTEAGTKVLLLQRHSPGEPADLAAESITAAEQALDALSVRGGGHFAIPNARSNRVLWWTTPDGVNLRINVEEVLILASSIQTRPAHLPRSDEASPASYEPAFRYFRRSQLAADVFGAFYHMYLAFERLVSRHFDRAKFRSERTWLEAALGAASTWCSPDVPSDLTDAGASEQFFQRVYAVRLRLFHAKEQEEHIIPGPGLDVGQVEAALQLLTPYVLELLRSTAGWQAGARLLTDHELAETAQYLHTPKAGLLLAGGGEVERMALPPLEPVSSEPGFHKFSVSVRPTRIDQPAFITGIATETLPGTLSKTLLGIEIPIDASVARIQVELHVGFRMEGNVRTLWSRRP